MNAVHCLVWLNRGNVTVNGNYAVNGNSDSQGGVMRHNGKDIGSTHRHSGIQAGKDNTGSPI